MKTVNRVLWGLALVVAGVILILNATGVADINVFFKGWWTLFIIVLSIGGLFEKEGRAASAVALVAGVALLLACQEVIEFEMVWKIILAAVLVAIGIFCIFGRRNYLEVHEIRKAAKKGEKEEYRAAFSGQKLKFDKEELEDFKAVAVMGGMEVDLRKAIIKKDVTIDATAVFGGIDILVPSDVVVKTTSSSIFGGVENKTRLDDAKSGKTIHVNVSAAFGGVEIK